MHWGDYYINFSHCREQFNKRKCDINSHIITPAHLLSGSLPAAKKCFEDVAQSTEILNVYVESIEASEWISCPAAICLPELVILLAFLLIAEYLVGFVNLLELAFISLAFVGMMLVGQFAVGALNFILGGCSFNP